MKYLVTQVEVLGNLAQSPGQFCNVKALMI